MKLGIRSKLVALLILVGLLPLTGALVTIVRFGSELRRESFGQVTMASAGVEAAELRWILINDIDNLQLVLGESRAAEMLSEAAKPYTPVEIAEIEDAWPSLTPNDPLLEGILQHPIDPLLRRLLRTDPRLVEVFVTDRAGHLIAATSKTTDYFQGDEAWWKAAYAEGKGQIYVPPVGYDRSAGCWSIDLCIPISRDGEVVGVAKAVMDVSRWMDSPRRAVFDKTVGLMLVSEEGDVVYREGVDPHGQRVEQWNESMLYESGWRVTHGGELQAYAPLILPGRSGRYPIRAGRWSLVLYADESEAMAALYELSALVLGIGLVIILAIFAVGIGLVERSVVRRLRLLAGATRQVTEGNLEHRLESDWGGKRLLGSDEIDELAEDFNRMVDNVQASHEALRSANELKEDFIKIAGHELRTPVSYMLATGKLLADCQDTDRLRRAIETISFKARRLDKIITAMFKLMPSSEHLEEIEYEGFSLAGLLEEIYLESQPFVERRDQSLIIDTPEELPAVRGDRDKLFDVISNLVSNAIKFTPNGGTVRVVVSQELGGRVSISVSDQGPGIPDDELRHVFKPFFTGKDVMQHSTGWSGYQKRGIGLGLAVVKHFVELHHGSIRVQTGETGTTFTVTLPTDQAPALDEHEGQ